MQGTAESSQYPWPLVFSGVVWCLYGGGGLVFGLYTLSITGLYPDSVGGRGVTWGYQAAEAIANLIPITITLIFLLKGITAANKSARGVVAMGIFSTVMGALTAAIAFDAELPMGTMFRGSMILLGSLLVVAGVTAFGSRAHLQRFLQTETKA